MSRSTPYIEEFRGLSANKRYLRMFLQKPKPSDNAVVDMIKLILLNYSNFSIAKIVVKKIERVK